MVSALIALPKLLGMIIAHAELQTRITAVGNIIGPQFFRISQAPTYGLGIGAMLCCFAIMAVTGALYG